MRFVSLVLLLVAVVLSGAALAKRQQGAVLRDQVELLRADLAEMERLRAEHARLAAEQPAEAELQRLRADSAASERLRSELNALRAKVEAAERELPNS